jgi:hypothetical protein
MSKGTIEMAGGRLEFSQTYTYSDGGSPLNLTILDAEYLPGRFSLSAGGILNADVDHKLVLVHYRLKNAGTSDLYVSSGFLFQAIDDNGNTIADSGQRRESETSTLGATLKPGQGIDDLEDCIIVPSQGPVTKLILQMGRMGTSDQVTRFDLGTAPNVIKPLTAPYADPADPKGTTLASKINATMGTVYQAGVLDMTLDSVSLEASPIGTASGSWSPR